VLLNISNILEQEFSKRTKNGLAEDSRKFIASSFTSRALRRFSQTNGWRLLQEFGTNADPNLWRPFFFNSTSFAMWELLPSQIAALKCGLLKGDGNTVSLQMPARQIPRWPTKRMQKLMQCVS